MGKELLRHKSTRGESRKGDAYRKDIGRLPHTRFDDFEAGSARPPWAIAVFVLLAGACGLLIMASLRPLVAGIRSDTSLADTRLADTSASEVGISSPALGTENTIAAQKTDTIALAGGAPLSSVAHALPGNISRVTNIDDRTAMMPFNNPSLNPRRAVQMASASLGPTPAPTTPTPTMPTSEPRGFWPRLKPSLDENSQLKRTATPTTQTANLEITPQPPQFAPIADNDPLSTHPLNLRPTSQFSQEAVPVSFLSHEDLADPTSDYNGMHTHQYTRASYRSPAALLSDYDRDLSIPAASRVYRLRRGETFVDLLQRAGIAKDDRNAAAGAIAKHLNLRALRPGFEMEITSAPPNQTLFQAMHANKGAKELLIAIDTRSSDNKKLSLYRKTDGSFTAKTRALELTRRLRASAGVIKGNLYTSMKAQGAPDSVINSLANVFAYDVDFQREIFEGDRFEAIYEIVYDEEGNVVEGGQILFGKLSWRGNRREKEYYFFDPNSKTQAPDFFDADAKSARRLLMKTPIDGARLSSRFGPRKHPILGYRKTHKGVDFAARRGTPIKATGDGVIQRANRYGSFGNYIRIKHANGYETAYAHLNGFARGIKKGRRVRQGDIIGYVGTTGRSTGPHLHYEVHKGGKAVNPQTLKIATGVTLNGTLRDKFISRREKIDRLRIAPDKSAPQLTAAISPAVNTQIPGAP